MAAQPQPWIDQSLALLEQMETERSALARALADIESRIENIGCSVDRTDVLLDELEERSERVQKARRELRERQEQITRAQDELWQRLHALRNDRERLKAAERRLALDAAIVENQGAGLPEELSSAEQRRRDLEHKLAHLNVLRRDVAMELAKLEVEMNRMMSQLEAMADAEEDRAGHPEPIPVSYTRSTKLRLVTEIDDESRRRTRNVRALNTASFDKEEPSKVTTLRFNGDLAPDSELFLDEEERSASLAELGLAPEPAPVAPAEQAAEAALPVAPTPEAIEPMHWIEEDDSSAAAGVRWPAWWTQRRNQGIAAGAVAAVGLHAWALSAMGGSDAPASGTAMAGVVPVAASEGGAAGPVTVIPSAPVEPDPNDFAAPAPAAIALPDSEEPRDAVGTTESRPRSPARRSAPRRGRVSTPSNDASEPARPAKRIQLRADDDPLAGL